MRTTWIVLAALVGGLLLGFGAQGHAQEGATFLGAVRARTYTHSYKMPLDVGADSVWKPAERIDEERARLHVPDVYGELIEVTPHGDSVVMWFRDADGVVRNAVVADVTTKLLHVERAPARHIGYSYR